VVERGKKHTAENRLMEEKPRKNGKEGRGDAEANAIFGTKFGLKMKCVECRRRMSLDRGEGGIERKWDAPEHLAGRGGSGKPLLRKKTSAGTAKGVIVSMGEKAEEK